MLLINYAKENNKKLLTCFMDFEKAFDFSNRAKMSEFLMDKGCGKRLTDAIIKTLTKSVYHPKISNQRLGDGIESVYGVTQGRKSSANLFSLYLSDMSTAFDDTRYTDFMSPCIFAQLADDTALFAEFVESLREKIVEMLEYSKRKYQIPNMKKTFYCEFDDNPTLEPLQLDDDSYIDSVKMDTGYPYIGVTFIPTKDTNKIIEKNINKKMHNVAKYYGWLANNESTPIEMKLQTLDMCMFNALLHGSETWGDFSKQYGKLRMIERKALKAILKVKSGTTNDLVYHELRRGDIVSKIKDRQCNFYKKLVQLPDDEAIVNTIIELCKDTVAIAYYENLHDHNAKDDVFERERRIKAETTSMTAYYVNMKFEKKSCIYESFLNDEHRKIITRWRLSNHDLKIETGRYHKIPREHRVCDLCEVLEDEQHVIFVCPRYIDIREQHQELLTTNADIQTFLNPEKENVLETAKLLHEIEALRKL